MYLYWRKVWFVPEPTRLTDWMVSLHLGKKIDISTARPRKRQDFPPRTMVSGGRPGVEVDYCWLVCAGSRGAAGGGAERQRHFGARLRSALDGRRTDEKNDEPSL